MVSAYQQMHLFCKQQGQEKDTQAVLIKGIL